jgi:hypothetical protein
MTRTAIVVVVAGILGLAAVAPAAAESRTDRRDRFDARTQRMRIEARLAQLQAPSTQEIEYSTPYLPYVEGDRGVDQRIRRLGELIRRQEQAER